VVPVDVVIPTLGRPSLAALLDALRDVAGRVIVVDDRPVARDPLALPGRVEVVRGRAAGPAAARNLGWRAAATEWVAFLDDDVRPPAGWYGALLRDLAACEPDVGGSQGRIVVPLPRDRRPTDWERNVAGLERARWATADLAYRRAALAEVGGFDERFPRAYREDADLGLRMVAAGYSIVAGERQVSHPVRPAGWWVSVRLQRGNADDPLMRALHGRGWRQHAGVPPGRRPAHLATTAAGLLGLAGLVTRHRRLAAVGGLGYLAGAAELAWRRIAPGPRTPAEVATMAATSAVLPAVAAWWYAAGWVRVRTRLRT
jgi:cellulose synthase/poly-beta-1,6-N-acetylglucosamine synthase-like glycosyltransferase